MRQGRGRLGEEDSDVDIEGYDDEEEDGKPKTPAPVSMLTESLWLRYTLNMIGAPTSTGQAKSQGDTRESP